MNAPREVYDRIARAIDTGTQGDPWWHPVSVCVTERGAQRVARKHPDPRAFVRRTPDGFTVYARHVG